MIGVVPSLTIQPMQTEKTTTASNVLATSGKGKGKEIEASGPGACASEYSDDDEPPVRKSKKKRNLAQTVDEGGDIAMAESSRAVPTQQTARPYSKAAGKQRTHSKVLSKASDESDPDSTDDAGARSSQSLAEKARKSLQRLETTANGPKEGAKSNNANATQAPGAMATMMKASSWHRKKGGQSVDGAVASVAETKTSLKRKRADEVDKATVAAAVARERAMRMLGIFGGDDEDDDDVSPYFKKEE